MKPIKLPDGDGLYLLVQPYIGKRPVAKLDAPDFLECLERMQRRGVLETAHKVKTKCSEVMRYAVATHRAPRDPLVDLKGALPPVRVRHYASITFPAEVGALRASCKRH